MTVKLLNLIDGNTAEVSSSRPESQGQFCHISIETFGGATVEIGQRETISASPSGGLSVDLSGAAPTAVSRPTELQASIFLPMPDVIQFPYGARWQIDSGGTLARLAGNAVAGDLSKGLSELGADAKNLIQQITESTTGKRLAQKVQGKALNPNLELLYTQPEMRAFDFAWTFAFKSQAQVDQFAAFVDVMLQAMHPEFQNVRNGLWTIPDTFKIEFVNAKIRKINSCVLTGFNEGVTASGAGWKAFTDGSPAFVTIQASFKEIEPLVKQDIQAGF